MHCSIVGHVLCESRTQFFFLQRKNEKMENGRFFVAGYIITLKDIFVQLMCSNFVANSIPINLV